MNTYLKDALRLVLASAATAGVVVGTSNWIERILTFVVTAFTLIATFLFDSKDPRNHARAVKLLGLEGQIASILKIGNRVVPSGINPKLEEMLTKTKIALDHSQSDVKDETVRITLEDLVNNEPKIDPNAKPATNGIPPVDSPAVVIAGGNSTS